MKKKQEVFAKVFMPQLDCVARFMASYMEYQDRIGRKAYIVAKV